jgi:hypothetical protein
MNGDLKLRLTKLYCLDAQEQSFYNYLVRNLSEEALLGLDEEGREGWKCTVDVFHTYVENDGDDSAFMVGDGETFDIHIDKRMPFGMCVDFIIHELAHVHSWDRADPEEDHCEEFGKSWALLYRLYLYLYDNFWN